MTKDWRTVGGSDAAGQRRAERRDGSRPGALSVTAAIALVAGLLAFPPPGPAGASPGDITTVAGTGIVGAGRCGAGSTPIRTPQGVAVDAAGNVYLSDTGQLRVLKVDPVGMITTVAGASDGVAGDSGDGGPALAARFRLPLGVAVNAAGDVFISDAGAHRVRRVEAATGIITTIAGTGAFGDGGDGGPATGAVLNQPNGLAVDGSGNVFVADTGNRRVRRIDGAGTMTTVAGKVGTVPDEDNRLATEVVLGLPRDVSVDAAGNLLIADSSRAKIRRVDAVTRIITTVAGSGVSAFGGDGGLATDAGLGEVRGVDVTADGELLIASTPNDRIRRVFTDGTIDTVLGPTGIDGPFDVAVHRPSGAYFVADTSNNRIVRVGTDGQVTIVAGNSDPGFSGDLCAATDAQLDFPSDVAVRPDGSLLIADRDNNRVRQVKPDGIITTFAGTGSGSRSGEGDIATKADVDQPTSVAVGPDGSVYIADRGNDLVRRVSPAGILTTVAGSLVKDRGFSGDGGLATGAQFRSPVAVTVDAAGNLFVVDQENHRVRRVDAATGIVTTVAGRGGIDPNDPANDGGFSGDGGPATAARLSTPTDVAVDAAGNVYIADSGNNRIRRVDPSGTITTLAGTGFGFSGDGGPARQAELAVPAGIAWDGTNLFVSDTGNQRVRRIDALGRISTVAGNGQFGFTADGVAATSTTLADPSGLTVDAAGNVLFADSRNNRVRRVEAPPADPPPITTTTTTTTTTDPVIPDEEPRGPIDGYWLAGRDGGVFAFGAGRFAGSLAGQPLAAPVVAMAGTPSGNGYWLVASDGGVFAFGDARYRGSLGRLRLQAPVVGITPTPSGDGYLLVAADGGVFAFGDARYRGSLAALRLQKQVVGIASTPSGDGYWLVAADGGVFAFGDARYRGSLGRLTLNRPVVGMAPVPGGNGYWLVAADGGVFAFGSARYHGSLGRLRLNAPVLGLAASPSGNGYLLMGGDGGVFAFGDAHFRGSAGAIDLSHPIAAAAGARSG